MMAIFWLLAVVYILGIVLSEYYIVCRFWDRLFRGVSSRGYGSIYMAVWFLAFFWPILWPVVIIARLARRKPAVG